MAQVRPPDGEGSRMVKLLGGGEAGTVVWPDL